MRLRFVVIIVHTSNTVKQAVHRLDLFSQDMFTSVVLTCGNWISFTDTIR